MKIIFLGTNGWYSTPTGDTPCILIDSKDHYVVLDAGNGIYKLDRYITEDKPISMFISHFHLDHTSGLHILAKWNFQQGINVYVGEGRTKDFHTLVNPPYTIGIENKPKNIINLKTDLRVYELSEREEKIPFSAQTVKLHHAYGGHGYRIELEGKTIAYTGDAGLTDATRRLAKNADLLISECTNKENPVREWGHLDPTLSASLAKDQNVKQLILTHFGADIYTTLDDRKWAEDEAKKIFSATTAAVDGMEFEL
jgi:ribonuclease BN (tRNA processing enzyme)